MKNPFVYGKEVSKENFCNRKKEINEIKRDIENSQNVLIFSQRRFGKTSLIKRVFEELNKKNTLSVYVDLYPLISEEDFIRIYANTVSKAITRGIKEKIADIVSVFKKLRPVYTLDQYGGLNFSFDIKKDDIIPMINDVLESINRYISDTPKNAVVCFDEFQQVGQLNSDRLEKEMRSVFQTHSRISYIFMGSKKHMIRDMFNNPNRPFYKSAKSFPLGKIEKNDLEKFITAKYQNSGKPISEEIVSMIINECESHPYYIQYLCHVLWENALEGYDVKKKDVESSFEIMMKRESSTFEATWDSLTSKQKKLIKALAKYENYDKIYSEEFLSKYDIGPASSIQRAVEGLIDKDLIDKTNETYSIMDIVFKKWIITQDA